MSTYVPRHYAAWTLFKIGVGLHEVGQALRYSANRLDVVIAARRKMADDRRVLSEMNEREFRDIGVSDGQLYAFQAGSLRHGPEPLCVMEWRQPM